jgi:prephenate dehydrogenase
MPGVNDSPVVFDTVAIIGVGLIGGSIGMASRRRGIARRVIGIGRTEQRLMRAKILGAIDEYSLDVAEGVAEADLVIICMPVSLVVPTLEAIAPSLKAGAIVTDAGSTKREIVEQAEQVLAAYSGSDSASAQSAPITFIGGHPMAGSEQTGVDAARADLFMGATYVLTPGTDTDFQALARLSEFAGALGALVEVLGAKQHDEAVAVISHLPHAIASALVQIAEESQRQTGKTFQLAAGSFRDLTRISDSSPELWRDIFMTNADSLSAAITSFQETLEELKSALQIRDEAGIKRFFEQAQQIRQTYLRITR